MDVFKPFRNYFRQRAAKALTDKLSLLSLCTTHGGDTSRGVFPFPGTKALIVGNRDGARIGYVDYSLGVLRDRVYINKIETTPGHYRKGYALTLLWHLWQEHQVPIVPIREYELANEFWDKARHRFKAAGAEITSELGSHRDMQEEGTRWQDLVPESEVERSIRLLRASDEWPAVEAELKATYGTGLKV